MRSRTIRWAGALALFVSLLRTPMPPARAATLFAASTIGAVTVVGGMGYPILTLSTTTHVLGGTPLQTVGHAVGATGSTCTPLGAPWDNGVTNCRLVFPNARAVAMGSISCLDVPVHLLKSKSVLSPPGCSFSTIAGSLPNVITGHCGLNSGRVTLRYVAGSGAVFILDVTFSATAGNGYTIVTGHASKTTWNGSTQRGLVVGLLDQTPPTPQPLLLTTNESCLNKTARDWIYTGVIVAYAV